MQLGATVFFALALVHTFLVKRFQNLACRHEEGSMGENLFHLLGEVEVVFGLWAGIYLVLLTLVQGSPGTIEMVQSLSFTEPMFVFVILVICSTKPILDLAFLLIQRSSSVLPLPSPLAFYVTTLTLGPWLGSLITEPAAMTVVAVLLNRHYFRKKISDPLKYATLGLLFVNISIGGTLTHFAAPPVLMVASKWNWNLIWMLTHFGWKGMLACILSTALVAFRFRDELKNIESHGESETEKVPHWLIATHLIFLVFIVLTSHSPVIFVGIFLFFLGLTSVTREYQQELKLREGLRVAFFLGGIVVLGAGQGWWLVPLLSGLQKLPLYLGAIGLTAFTDNAALTYLGSLVPTLSEDSRYALVAGAVVGGGLTVIANAPNPAGYGILNPAFGKDGISPLGLFRSALIPTLISAACFWFF
ncbi:MAG: putative Na+/H+ antiporter [Methylotenera sp.]|nr:putative Na+/H+ antiporter [Oligoflexia bacterium]